MAWGGEGMRSVVLGVVVAVVMAVVGAGLVMTFGVWALGLSLGGLRF
jgi:hypothetical protein